MPLNFRANTIMPRTIGCIDSLQVSSKLILTDVWSVIQPLSWR